MDTYSREAAATSDVVMDCTECGARDGMRRTHDLMNGLERKCGEIWTCTECGSEYIDEW